MQQSSLLYHDKNQEGNRSVMTVLRRITGDSTGLAVHNNEQSLSMPPKSWQSNSSALSQSCLSISHHVGSGRRPQTVREPGNVA